MVLSRRIGGRSCREGAEIVPVAPSLLSPDRSADVVVRRLVVDVIVGDECCDSEMNECSNGTGEVMRRSVRCVVGDDGNCGSNVNGEMMHRSVRYAIGGSESRGDDVNEWSDVTDVVGRQMVEGVLVDGEVCGGSVSGRSLLYPGLLSPDP